MSIFLTQIAENPISATFKIDQLQLQWLDNNSSETKKLV
jgi:hypothetical protein